MQSGASVLRSYVRVMPNELASWSDSAGTGLTQILAVVGRLLRQDLPDPAVLYCGPLVTAIVQRFASVLEPSVLGNMLEAVLRRMYTVSWKCKLLFFYGVYHSYKTTFMIYLSTIYYIYI